MMAINIGKQTSLEIISISVTSLQPLSPALGLPADLLATLTQVVM